MAIADQGDVGVRRRRPNCRLCWTFSGRRISMERVFCILLHKISASLSRHWGSSCPEAVAMDSPRALHWVLETAIGPLAAICHLGGAFRPAGSADGSCSSGAECHGPI